MISWRVPCMMMNKRRLQFRGSWYYWFCPIFCYFISVLYLTGANFKFHQCKSTEIDSFLNHRQDLHWNWQRITCFVSRTLETGTIKTPERTLVVSFKWGLCCSSFQYVCVVFFCGFVCLTRNVALVFALSIPYGFLKCLFLWFYFVYTVLWRWQSMLHIHDIGIGFTEDFDIITRFITIWFNEIAVNTNKLEKKNTRLWEPLICMCCLCLCIVNCLSGVIPGTKSVLYWPWFHRRRQY